MTLKAGLRGVFLALGLLAAASCTATGTGAGGGPVSEPATVTTRSPEEQKFGDEAHAKILTRYGGAYRNAKVQRYVERIGKKLAAQSEQPNEKWTFTVLDTPQVNAFALPGGYIYVTRGLLGLANDEAQLAGVIGHEIGHVTAGHSLLRKDRNDAAQVGLTLGAIGLSVLGVNPGISTGILQAGSLAAGGVLAEYSREDELAADQLGIRYMARAGYDPYAQADFIDSMGDSAGLDAKISGQAYNPNRVGFFATHPATGPRTRQAIEVAKHQKDIGAVGTDRHRDRYLRTIDGITYGDSEAQGFVDGRTFSHPVLRFTYTAPENFKITNSANAVVASGPQQSRFILDGDRDRGLSLPDYITKFWVPGIARNYRVGQVRALEKTTINGLDAARALVPARINNTNYDVLMVVVRMNGALYRLTGLAPQRSGLLPSMADAAESFRQLSAAEANKLKAKRIKTYKVRPGDTVAKIAAKMSVDAAPEERFRILNGMRPGEEVKPGTRVKLIR